MAYDFVVAVEAVKRACERVREGQATDEVANGDLPILELGLKVDVAIALEGVEKDLPVGAFDDRVQVVPVVSDFQRVSPRALIGSDTQIRHTSSQRVLGDRCVLQKRNGHASFSIHCRGS